MPEQLLNPDSVKALGEIKERSKGRKVAFVSGNFNILHPGHLRLLRFAAECGEFLVIGVYADALEREAILEEHHRLEGVDSTSWIDYAFILRDNPEDFIAELKPAVVVKGKEHESSYNSEAEVVASYGGQLLFSSGDVTFSSLNLLKDEFNRLNAFTIEKPDDYPRRHHFNMSDVHKALETIKGIKVVVVGDLIVDEYISCDPLGMSQEDPTLVVTPILSETFVGGAGIVAAHAAGLGAEVRFFSVSGDDPMGDFAEKRLGEYGVKTFLYKDNSRPTPHKQRFRANARTLLRVNHLRSHDIGLEMRKRMFRELLDILDDTQLLIFSDFNYGCLTQSLVDNIICACGERGIMMAADSQSSSQIGDVSRFKSMSLLTPTEREARLAVQDNNSGLVVLAEKLCKKSNSNNMLLTLGEEGLLIHAEGTNPGEWMTDRLPAMNQSPKDVAGAGDSLLAGAAMAMASGCDIWLSAYLGSLAAACQVGRIGNLPLSIQEIEEELKI